MRAFRFSVVAATVSLFGITVPAHAEWTRAESKYFIAYSEEAPESLRQRVEKLEKFGQVLEIMTNARRGKDDPVKITVYFLPTTDDVAQSLPFPSPGVAGYYSTTMRGPYTVMPRSNTTGPGGRVQRVPDLTAQAVLQHELTHHFMFQYFPRAYPAWYTEGFADYAGALEIDDNNVVKIGMFLQGRARALRALHWVHLRDLMSPDARKKGIGIEIYSQGWITVHYLNSNPERRKLLTNYLIAINRGKSFDEALKELGDIDELNRQVLAYSKQRELPAEALKFHTLNAGDIQLRTLSGAESALVTKQMRMSSGIPAAQAQTFAREVRAIARTDPKNPYVRRMLVDAEILAGNEVEARAALTEWLAADPTDAWANFFQGDLDARALARNKSTDRAAWSAARKRLELAIKTNPREARFARAYYESWLRTGVLPPAIAQNHLSNALDLLPYEQSLRMMVARDYEARGMLEDAISTISPLAYGVLDESDRDKRRREKAMDRYKLAEDDDDKETPREMLTRLLEKQAADPLKPKAPAPAPTK